MFLEDTFRPIWNLVQNFKVHINQSFNKNYLFNNISFLGDENCFLFQIFPSFATYNPTGYNKNFVYLNVGQETIPNGWVGIF